MLRFLKSILFIIFYLSYFRLSYAQNISDESANRQIVYHISTSFYGSANETPFWHYANTNGRIRSGSSFNNLNTIGFHMPFNKSTGRFDISAGAEVISRLSDGGDTFHFQQLYGSLRVGVLKISIGRFYEALGSNMHELSSGSMIQSPNATPVPKISLEMTRFVDIPLTNGIMQFRAHYSDGKLEDDRFIDSPFLHQKSLYLKFNIKKAEIITGVLHNVTWGGTDPERGKLPSGFNDYLRAVFVKSADPSPDSNAPVSDQLNKLGNVNGAFEFAIRYDFGSFQLLGFRQIYLEDQESIQAKNLLDGVFGLGFRRQEGKKFFSGIAYEHMNTIRQDARKTYPRGRSNYFGNGIYKNGWTFHGNVLGNPLLTFDSETLEMTNNMIVAHHIGVDGWLSNRFQYRALATYSRNYGVCRDLIITGRCAIDSRRPAPPNLETRSRSELRRDQYSTLLEGTYLVSEKLGIRLFGSLAMDAGDFLGNDAGFMGGVSWEGFLLN